MRPTSLVTAATAAAVVIAAAVVLAVAGRDPPSPGAGSAASGNAHRFTHPLVRVSAGVTVLDAHSGRVRAVVPSLVVQRPVEVRYAEDGFWVFDAAGPALDAVDARSGEVQDSVPSPTADLGALLPDGGTLWVSDERTGRVTQIDGRDGSVLRSFGGLPGRGGSVGLALSRGLLWVARPEAAAGQGVLVALDPRSGRVRRRIQGLLGTYQLAPAPDGSFWTAGTFGSVNHIDLGGSGRTHGETGGRNYAIASDGHHAWTADSQSGTVYQLDRQGAVDETYATAPGARAVAYANGAVWIGNIRDGSVTRIASGGRIDVWRFDHRVVSLAAGDGVVLVEFGGPTRVDGA